MLVHPMKTIVYHNCRCFLLYLMSLGVISLFSFLGYRELLILWLRLKESVSMYRRQFQHFNIEDLMDFAFFSSPCVIIEDYVLIIRAPVKRRTALALCEAEALCGNSSKGH